MASWEQSLTEHERRELARWENEGGTVVEPPAPPPATLVVAAAAGPDSAGTSPGDGSLGRRS